LAESSNRDAGKADRVLNHKIKHMNIPISRIKLLPGMLNWLKINPGILLCAIVICSISIGCASLESKRYQSRVRAVKKIEDQSKLYKIAINDLNYFVKYEAMGKLQQELLEKACIDGTETRARLMAVKFINDQSRLIRITEENRDWEVRRLAFNKLSRESIAYILKSSEKEDLKAAIKIRLGLLSWKDLIIQNDGSKQSLDIFIGASALVDDPVPPTDFVVSLCHKYIRFGDIRRIPELKYLLLKYGDKSLAEDYLNCGQSELREAGILWGQKNGFPNVVHMNDGSHRVRWGENSNTRNR